MLGRISRERDRTTSHAPIPRFLYCLSTLSIAMYPRLFILCIDCLHTITPTGTLASAAGYACVQLKVHRKQKGDTYARPTGY